MCIKLLEWFNNDFLFIFESNTFKNCNKYKESNRDKLHHNIKIIIDEPKISPSNSNTSLKTNVSTPSSKDEYDLYTWDIL